MEPSSTLAPFIAWLATREDDEQVRRRHRMLVEHYLVWCRTERGSLPDRRARFLTEHTRDGGRADHVEAALARFDEFCAMLSATADR
ncbi:MAG: hypothetical protein EKK42_02690 [Pseudonocardiaceae bacterium]|nr:MAG: hypothetical protein EKK42_02690 [Pseudonocardiaceae bacterium]